MRTVPKYLSITLASSSFILSAPIAFAINICGSGSGVCSATPTAQAFLNNALTVVAAVAALIALVFLIWGGIKWITAGGDKTKVQAARDTIVGAIIGLVIVFVAYFVVGFVYQLVTGNSISGGLNLPSLLKGKEVGN